MRYLVMRSTWNVFPPLLAPVADGAILTDDEWKRVISDDYPGLQANYAAFLEEHGPYGHRYNIRGKKQPGNASWLDE